MTTVEASGYIKRFFGNSGDLKPLYDMQSTGYSIPVGSEYRELDTSHLYIFDGTTWRKFLSLVTTS